MKDVPNVWMLVGGTVVVVVGGGVSFALLVRAYWRRRGWIK